MKRSPTRVTSVQEPLGIVISSGSRDVIAPTFWAYVWGPAPEDGFESVEPKAA